MRSTFYATTGNMRTVLTSGHGFCVLVFSQFSVFVSLFYSSPFCDLNCFRPQTSFHSTQSSHIQLLLLLPCLFNSIYPPTHLHPSFSFLLHIYSSRCPCSLLQTNTSVCSHPSFSIFFFFPPPPLLPHPPGATWISYFQSQIAVAGMPNRTRDTCGSTLACCHLTSNEKRRNKRHRLRRR